VPTRVAIPTIRPLRESDIPEARRILRLAFGTHAGVPDPENQGTDVDYVALRLRTDPSAAFAAEVDGKLVGSNFATRWGSFGFFGPLTVHPDYWDRSIGHHLIQPVMECFEKWKITQAGLFTFADSAKHIGLYQKFGFWPRFLTAIMSREARRREPAPAWSRFSELPSTEQESILQECGALTDAVYPGLNVELETRAVCTQAAGETILVWNDSRLVAFAVCHCGSDTEAGENRCYIKFGAALPGSEALRHFHDLITACDVFADSSGLAHLDAGMNLARIEAYRHLLECGFRTMRQGVAMHAPNEPGHSWPGVFVIDDWR
jgi:predicted N-acetyltransferase YhbS